MTRSPSKDNLGLRRPTIPVAYPRLLMQLFAERGLDQRALRVGTGLRDEVLAQPDARISPSQWARLVLNAIALTGDEGFGFELGLRLRPSVHGFLGYAAMTAPDLRTALEVNARYFRTRNRQYTLAYAEHGDGATLTLAGVQSSPVLRHHTLFEFVLAGLAQSLPALTGRDAPPLELRFAWPEPPYFAPYRERLPPVRFDCEAHALWIAREALGWPLALADEVAHRQALAQVEREYAAVRQDEGDWVERVRAELVAGADGYPDPDALARRLHVSTRTLRRRLDEAGAGYRALLDEARYRDARQLLRASDLDLKTIAEQLRFSDPANFTRAFRKWAGVTPSAYRRDA
ncbi:AraC family transcriptional regulator [Burkholderia gladioli]|uniref:AraC family transcriptional regulator n=1 Tax=Burkholderia gladioli TaxID=28095 RepID=UPI002FDF6E9C